MAAMYGPRPDSPLPVPLSRRRRGRWVGGVCAGLAQARGLPVRWVRAAFVGAAALAGLGLLVYVACWLIIPAEGERADAQRSRGVVLVAQWCAAMAGLATLGAAGAAATIFGFGGLVLALGLAVLLLALAAWPRVGPAWALLPVAAMTVPSLAMAAGHVRIAAQTGSVHAAPRTAAALERGYRSGLGTLLVDLRHTALPAHGTVPLTIDAGVRRTVVALPPGRCVHVSVDWHVTPFAARLADLVTRRSTSGFTGIVVFGTTTYDNRGALSDTVQNPGRARMAGPTVQLRFRSAGGSLLIRDYPDHVDPERSPDWPGYPVQPEPRPDIEGVPKSRVKALLRHWVARHRAQVSDAQRVDALMPGPCVPPARKRATR